MSKSKIFAELLDQVSKTTEITKLQILSSSKEIEVVDARAILVYLLNNEGFYPVQIASFLHKTPASIRYLLSTFQNRKNNCKMIEKYLLKVNQELKNI